MARVNVDKMTLRELLALEMKLQKAIALARKRERAKVKEEFTALAEKRGFTLSELLDGRSKRKLDGRSKRKSVAPRYANPDDSSQTWTGRGRRPAWLVAKMKEKGAKLEQFAL